MINVDLLSARESSNMRIHSYDREQREQYGFEESKTSSSLFTLLDRAEEFWTIQPYQARTHFAQRLALKRSI